MNHDSSCSIRPRKCLYTKIVFLVKNTHIDQKQNGFEPTNAYDVLKRCFNLIKANLANDFLGGLHF